MDIRKGDGEPQPTHGIPASPSAGSDRTPMTEEQILAASVVPPAPLTSHIHLEEYDTEWPRLFEREATRIRTALGDGVVQLEHVGSTSVPGLAAKPIIDI